MAFHKLFLTFFLCIIIDTCYGQGKNYDLSAPIDLKQTGWNKVLYLKNGNTMLFNFDRNMPVIVKVFDSAHKEIASQKHLCRILDISRFETAVFKGLYDVNGEAVLFFEQEHLSKRGLVRIRFNCNNGKIIEEKLMGESSGFARPMQFYVMKNKEDDDYEILYCTEVAQLKQCDLHVTYYNSKHESIKDIPLDVDRKKYDLLYVVGAESQPNGICITLNLTILVSNQTISGVSSKKAIYDHHVAIYHIPKESSKVKKTVVDVSTDVYPNYTKYTYNPFAKAFNLLLYSYQPIRYIFGLNIERGSASDNLFFKSDPDNGEIKLNYVKNKVINSSIQKTDSAKVFYGIPLSMFTNENGLTTVISESYERFDEPETNVKYNYYTYLGNIGITQLDDDGNELWGILLPHSEYFKSYKRFYKPLEFAQKKEAGYPYCEIPRQDYQNPNPLVFNKLELPEQVYQRQFLSLNTYYHDKNFYIIFNDVNRNFNNTIEKPGDTVFSFNNTNACYYKLNRKREITRHYLFGEPAANEYKCCFIEGADFDEKRGIYATLVQYKKGDDISLRIAWVSLD